MDYKPTPKRPAREGELCSWGRAAVVVLLLEDLGPVPSCDTSEVGRHRPDDCPSWCVEEHDHAIDRLHRSETYRVELDAHPWQQEHQMGGWETIIQPIMAGITKEPNSKPAYIDLSSAEGTNAGHMTADEAEQLGVILRDLAATLRAAETVNEHSRHPASQRG